jgi:hypothetical protein
MKHVDEILFSITTDDVDFVFETEFPEVSEEQRESIKKLSQGLYSEWVEDVKEFINYELN